MMTLEYLCLVSQENCTQKCDKQIHAHLQNVIYQAYTHLHCEEIHIHLVNQGTTAKVQYRYLYCFNTSGVVQHDGQRFKIHSFCGLQILYLWKILYKKFLKLLTCHFLSIKLDKLYFKLVQQEAVCLYSSRWMLVHDIPSVFEDMKGGVSIPY